MAYVSRMSAQNSKLSKGFDNYAKRASLELKSKVLIRKSLSDKICLRKLPESSIVMPHFNKSAAFLKLLSTFAKIYHNKLPESSIVMPCLSRSFALQFY